MIPAAERASKHLDEAAMAIARAQDELASIDPGHTGELSAAKRIVRGVNQMLRHPQYGRQVVERMKERNE